MIKKALFSKQNIPFYCDKSEEEIKQDPYERYHPMVVRQSAIHLMDHLWNGYFLQEGFDRCNKILSNENLSIDPTICELGCSVGRWIASIAKNNPNSTCFGLDFSYQMIAQAIRVWNKETELSIDLASFGFESNESISCESLDNLTFGVAKAESLPFEDNSLDVVIANFLLDRLPNPETGLKEIYRCLKPDGILLGLTPLNFLRREQWTNFYPPIKLVQRMQSMGYSVIEWEENMQVKEPLDINGNGVLWNCIFFVLRK